MAFERITKLFRRGGKDVKAEDSLAPPSTVPGEAPGKATVHILAEAAPLGDEGYQQDVSASLAGGFRQVAGVIENLDNHLQSHAKLLATVQQGQSQLPELLAAQQKLVGMVVAAERGNQAVLQALTANLKYRDEVQQAALRQLGEFSQTLHRQREDYQDQMQLMLRLQRGSRRFLLFLLLLCLLGMTLLLGVLLLVALRPDLISGPRALLHPTPGLERRDSFPTPIGPGSTSVF